MLLGMLRSQCRNCAAQQDRHQCDATECGPGDERLRRAETIPQQTGKGARREHRNAAHQIEETVGGASQPTGAVSATILASRPCKMPMCKPHSAMLNHVQIEWLL